MTTAEESNAKSEEVLQPLASNDNKNDDSTNKDVFVNSSSDYNSAPAPPSQQGVVSSENSVASNNTLNAVPPAAAVGVSTASSTADTSSAVKSVSDVSSDTEDKKAEDGSSTPAATNEPNTPGASSAAPIASETKNALLLRMASPSHHPVAEFLFQLTKMLTDDNKDFIEWKHSTIFVHDPPGLEKQILPKYFRHSNYSSFQRQMNYFGFRKIAGKGKMAACTYVNENATEDITSLLCIKRKKTGVSGTAAKLLAEANKMTRAHATMGLDTQSMNNMMMMNGMNQMMFNGLGANMGGGMGMMGMNQAQQLALLQQQQNINMLGGAMGLNAGLQGINGLQGMNGLQGIPMGAGMNGLSNMLPIQGGNVSGLTEQQKILLQLQQAHASASNGLNGPAAMGNNVSNPALKNNFGNVFQSGAGTSPILTNDQGNLYSAGNGQWNGANPQALLMQQAATMGGLGSLSQGAAVGNAANASIAALDSSSNFRTLLNQQISRFSDGNQASSAPSTNGTSKDDNTGMVQGNLPQGLSYEQFFGMTNGAGAAGNVQQHRS